MNGGLGGFPNRKQTERFTGIVYSAPTDNVTVTGNNTWNRWSTVWQLTVPNVRAGQYVLLRAEAALANASNYTGVAMYRVTNGPTYLWSSVSTALGHVTGTSLTYIDTTPGLGDIVYEIYGGGNTGTVTLRNNGDSTFSIDEGSSIFVAQVYFP